MQQKLVIENLLGVAASLAVAANSNKTTMEVDLASRVKAGFFSLGYTVTGSGTFKLEYQASLDNATWVTPSQGNTIGEDLTAGSDILSFAPIPCAFMRIKITETGTSDPIAITKLHLFMQ